MGVHRPTVAPAAAGPRGPASVPWGREHPRPAARRRPAAPAVAPPAGEPVGLPVAGIVGEPVGEIVTGEAVVLGLRAASFASRILAAVLDAVLVGIVLRAAVVGSTSC